MFMKPLSNTTVMMELNFGASQNTVTSNTGHRTGFFQVTEEYFLLVEHLSRFMLGLLGMDEDGPEKIGSSISHPHLLYPITRQNHLYIRRHCHESKFAGLVVIDILGSGSWDLEFIATISTNKN